ncbi:hypothetical protein [Paenibacillus sp. PK3_47]|uniref:hypothetical protein n=1 Tax=Paenibacillus sp. PK3_47 TaxID=2072642 RepID=UPI00201D5C8A|nr:hypothetical protein [Paenibacillus sp. PK3_47]
MNISLKVEQGADLNSLAANQLHIHINTVASFPFVLGAVYILLFAIGQFTLPMAIIVLIFGIAVAIGLLSAAS